MPHYYFHVRDRGTVILPDSKGVELAGAELAADECRKIIEAVLSEEEWGDQVAGELELHVVDEAGRTVLVVAFRSVLARGA